MMAFSPVLPKDTRRIGAEQALPRLVQCEAAQPTPSRRLQGSGPPATLRPMDERIADDARFALLAKVRQARSMSARAKFLAGSELFDEACAWNLAGIAAQFPEADEHARRKELQRRLQLAERTHR
jgi:hypothetical protein